MSKTQKLRTTRALILVGAVLLTLGVAINMISLFSVYDKAATDCSTSKPCGLTSEQTAVNAGNLIIIIGTGLLFTGGAIVVIKALKPRK